MQQLEDGMVLLGRDRLSENEYHLWEQTTRAFIVRSFGSPSDAEAYFVSAAPPIAIRDPGQDLGPLYRDRIEAQLTSLRSCIEQLRAMVRMPPPSLKPAPDPTAPPARATGRRVFVVHGHEEAPREAAARLLERLGLTPIILHEQPNKGRTIIEKFEDYSDVGFAVVLLTPDDRGGRHDEPLEAQRLRARQNVWLELGFFLGKLGRGRVCALYRKGVEIPSDYQGVVLEELDDPGAWKYRLAEELKAAGYTVDMNRVRG
jgi:predicted nucleotide-binding protein